MIGSLRGKVIEYSEKYCLLEAGGVGYKIYAAEDTLERTRGEESSFFFIHTVVREDALDLYGFGDKSSLSLFEKLISISGIGPRGAIGILAIAPVENLARAIAESDIAYLTQVSGIGKKTAEKIILELRDKIDISRESALSPLPENEVGLALASLGYSQAEIREVFSLLDQKIEGTQAKIKAALQLLSKK